jgi:hypothetical protein
VGAAAQRWYPFGVEDVADGLQGQALGAHRVDAGAEFGVVAD